MFGGTNRRFAWMREPDRRAFLSLWRWLMTLLGFIVTTIALGFSILFLRVRGVSPACGVNGALSWYLGECGSLMIPLLMVILVILALAMYVVAKRISTLLNNAGVEKGGNRPSSRTA